LHGVIVIDDGHAFGRHLNVLRKTRAILITPHPILGNRADQFFVTPIGGVQHISQRRINAEHLNLRRRQTVKVARAAFGFAFQNLGARRRVGV